VYLTVMKHAFTLIASQNIQNDEMPHTIRSDN